jgi:hypothetical protein
MFAVGSIVIPLSAEILNVKTKYLWHMFGSCESKFVVKCRLTTLRLWELNILSIWYEQLMYCGVFASCKKQPLLSNKCARQWTAVFSMDVRAATVAMQRCSKHASSIRESVFSAWSVPRGYRRTQSENATEYRTVVESVESSCGTPACRDMSLELNWVESSELAAAE